MYEFEYMQADDEKRLVETTERLLTPAKGILCVDDNITAMGERLAKIRLPNNAEIRRQFRQLLFTAEFDRRLNENISGILLDNEGFHQVCDSGLSFVELLNKRKIAIGIKLDQGIISLSGSRNESTSQGLDYLRNRCDGYKKKGCHFAKWRCTYKISNHEPSQQCFISNATQLARFASIAQAAGLVPILHAEVLVDGDHELNRSKLVTETMLASLVKALNDHHVFLEGCLLEINMVTQGVDCEEGQSTYKIACCTLQVLRNTVPPAIPGILFSSGGQSAAAAIKNLNTIQRLKGGKTPWKITFCFGRVLHVPILRIWEGKSENTFKAHLEVLKRAWAVGEASKGRYIESDFQLREANIDMFTPNYNY